MEKYAVINLETGEILKTGNKKNIITKAEILSTQTFTKKDIEELKEDANLLKFLYNDLRKRNEIDKYGMIKVDGRYISDVFFNLGMELKKYGYTLMALKNQLSFRGVIKKTPTTDCKTWGEVYEALSFPANRNTCSKLKKFYLKNDIIREATKIDGTKAFVINPNIIRQSSHTSTFCIAVFKDITLKRIDKYSAYMLYANNLIEYDDLDR